MRLTLELKFCDISCSSLGPFNYIPRLSLAQSVVALRYQNRALKSSLQVTKAGPVGEWTILLTTPLCPEEKKGKEMYVCVCM